MYKHKRFVFYRSCIWAKLLNIILFAYDKRQNIYHASKHEKMFWIYNFSSLNLSICKHWLQNLINYLQTTKNLTHFRRKIFMFDLEMMSDFNDPITSLQKHNNVWKNIKQTYCLDHKRGNKRKQKIPGFLFPIFLWFNIHPSIFTVMYNLILSFGCYRENSFTVNLYGTHW